MAKAISSAADFLARIAGKAEPFEVDDLTVELCTLGWGDMQEIVVKYDGNQSEQLFQMALRGLSNPKIEEDELRKMPFALVAALGAEVSRRSGVQGKSDGPLDGDGSSLSS